VNQNVQVTDDGAEGAGLCHVADDGRQEDDNLVSGGHNRANFASALRAEESSAVAFGAADWIEGI